MAVLARMILLCVLFGLRRNIGPGRNRGFCRGRYLESGKNNHAAHRFFEKRGFTHISEIYKLA